MKTLILAQDDCAPDSYQTFKEDFLKLVGVSFEIFCQTAKKKDFDGAYYHTLTNIEAGLVVEISADDQFYKVYKTKEQEEIDPATIVDNTQYDPS